MTERQILSLLDKGKVLFRYPLKVYYQEGENDFGVSVPKRNFKRAVKRNLLKRRVREAFRHNSDILGDRTNVIFAYYVAKEVEEYERIEESVRQILSDMASR